MNITACLTSVPFAHRGLHSIEKPENSMAAIEDAVLRGFAVETDVRLSKDDRLVVFHDDSLARMTGDPRAVRECAVGELRRLRLSGGNERIPLLSELLKTVGGKTPLLIEIKNMPGVKAKKIASLLAEAMENYTGPFAVQSFNPSYVKAFKRLRPDVPCGLLGTAQATKKDFGNSLFWRLKARVVRELSLNFYVKPDFVSYCLQDLPRKRVERFGGVKLAWTVRSKEDEDRARGCADNIIFEHYLPRD